MSETFMVFVITRKYDDETDEWTDIEAADDVDHVAEFNTNEEALGLASLLHSIGGVVAANDDYIGRGRTGEAQEAEPVTGFADPQERPYGGDGDATSRLNRW